MAFVVTSGQLASIQANYGTFVGYSASRSVSLSPSLSLTYEQLWRAQPALRTVVGFLARNVASLGLDPYRRLSATDREKAHDHPIGRLLERPMPGGSITKYRLLSGLMHDLGIYDEAYWLKLRLPSGVAGIQPIPPSWVSPIGRSPFEAEGFRIYGPSGRHVDVERADMVQFHGYNPDDPRRGLAPVETLRQILAEEYSAGAFRDQMWRNGARVNGYIKRPAGMKWSQGAKARFETDWRAQYTGDGPATGGTPILEDGMEFVSSSVTPKDAQYVESRRLTREEVAAAYFLSPAMVGMMESTTIASFVELHKMLYQDTLPPWLVQIAQDIECQLLPDVDRAGADDGSVYIEFNLAEKLRGSFEAQASALQSAVGGPWMTRDEARARNNLPHLDGADELIVPLNVITGGLASPNDTAPDEPDNGPSNGEPPKSAAEVLRAYFARQAKSVMSRVGAGFRTPDDICPADRWLPELHADLTPFGLESFAEPIHERTSAHLVTALAADDPNGAVADLYATYAGSHELEPVS